MAWWNFYKLLFNISDDPLKKKSSWDGSSWEGKCIRLGDNDFIDLSSCTGKPKTEAQGIMDAFKLLDSETIDKIKAILDVVDVDENGWINIKLSLKVKKEIE